MADAKNQNGLLRDFFNFLRGPVCPHPTQGKTIVKGGSL